MKNKFLVTNNKLRGYLTTKAFTLIELLAIIVILAIIAVITVPIILNVIENAKKGSVIDSAYGYKDSIQKYYMSENVNNAGVELPTGTYDITDLPSNFDVSGEHPSEGWVKLEKGRVIAYSLKFGDYVVTMNENSEPIAEKGGDVASNGGQEQQTVINMTEGIKVGNVQYYTGQDGATANDSDNIVYFDPTSNTGKCTVSDYDASNSTTGYNGVDNPTSEQTSCLRFYIFSIDDKGTASEADDVVNMILDHNTSTGIRWHDLNNYSGPTVAAEQLATDTSSWTSNKLITPSSYTATWDYDANRNSTIDKGEHHTYTITYTTKARMIEADEVAKIMNNTTWTYPTATSTISSLPAYLKADLTYTRGNYGYWTSSPYAGSSYGAWDVYISGFLHNHAMDYTDYGVRPVISVLKSDIL